MLVIPWRGHSTDVSTVEDLGGHSTDVSTVEDLGVRRELVILVVVRGSAGALYSVQ